MRYPSGPTSKEQGFTLTELLAVVAIIAVLAAIAIPSLTRDDAEARFNKFVKTFLGDVQRAHMGAIAAKEDWLIVIKGTSYELQRMPGPTAVDRRVAPTRVFVAGVTAENAADWNSGGYTAPGSVAPTGSTSKIRFQAMGWAEVDVGAGYQRTTASVFFADQTGDYKMRAVIFPATSHAQLFNGW